MFLTDVFPVFAMYWPAFSNRTTGSSEQETARLTGNMAIEYAKQLTGFGLNKQDILDGLEVAKQQTFTPNPTDFRDCCLPFSIDSVVREITERRGKYRFEDREWSHEVVQRVNNLVGFEINRLSADRARKIAKECLIDVLRTVANGEFISKPLIAIEHNQSPSKPYAEQIGYKPKSFEAKALMDRINRNKKGESDAA